MSAWHRDRMANWPSLVTWLWRWEVRIWPWALRDSEPTMAVLARPAAICPTERPGVALLRVELSVGLILPATSPPPQILWDVKITDSWRLDCRCINTSYTCISNIDNTPSTKMRQAITGVRQKRPLPTARSPRRWWISRLQNLEGYPDHHEEIQMLTPHDILTFYIWDRFLRRILTIYNFLYLYSIW
jgi:hypothetical protein